MPIVVKEIRVNTVVEKKLTLPEHEDISQKTLELIKKKVLEELLIKEAYYPSHSTKKER